MLKEFKSYPRILKILTLVNTVLCIVLLVLLLSGWAINPRPGMLNAVSGSSFTRMDFQGDKIVFAALNPSLSPENMADLCASMELNYRDGACFGR